MIIESIDRDEHTANLLMNKFDLTFAQTERLLGASDENIENVVKDVFGM